MPEQNVTPQDTTRVDEHDLRANRKRRRKALLAGGLVLGVGAAVTLAAWSDDVFAGGTFAAGTFELQGNTVSGDTGDASWADYDGPAGSEDGVAQLEFELSATNMSPAQTVYAPLSVATSEDTSLDGTFTLTGVESDGAFTDVLSYAVYPTASHGENCAPDAADGLGDAWAEGPAAATEPTPGEAFAVAGEQVDSQNLCIAVTMGGQDEVEPIIDGLGGGETGDTAVTWTFTGTSVDE